MHYATGKAHIDAIDRFLSLRADIEAKNDAKL
jgi:hypothetical protein